MTVAEALSLMVTFAAFVAALITLVVHLIKMNRKNNYPHFKTTEKWSFP